jgi:hypothetical protein
MRSGIKNFNIFIYLILIMVDDIKNTETLTEEKEQMKVKVNKEYATPESTINFLRTLVDSISTRFTKKYRVSEDEKSHFM